MRRITATHPEHQRSFRRTRTLTLACQTPRRLGPRSLLPPLFLERCVRAYSRPGCCLPTSATAYDVRALSTGLPFPRRDDGHDHLPFLTHHARPLRLPRTATQSGDTRRAAHSSVRPDPGAGSSCLRRFARPRYRSARPTSKCLRTASRVGIDVHGSLDRVKDVSSRVEALVGRLHIECVRLCAR